MGNTNILNKDKIYYISFKDDNYNGMFGTPVKCGQYYKLKLGKQVKFVPNVNAPGYFDVLQSDVNGGNWHPKSIIKSKSISEAEQDYFSELADDIYLSDKPSLQNNGDEPSEYQATIVGANPMLYNLFNHYIQIDKNQTRVHAFTTSGRNKPKLIVKYLCAYLNIMPGSPEANVLFAAANQD